MIVVLCVILEINYLNGPTTLCNGISLTTSWTAYYCYPCMNLTFLPLVATGDPQANLRTNSKTLQ